MRKASLLTIFLIVFIDLIGFGILLPNQQYYGETFGIHNVFYLTLIGPTYSLFQFAFAPILGKWSDRIGRRPVLIVSQIGTLVGYTMLFAAHYVHDANYVPLSIFMLYFSRVIDGISGGNISTASAYVADITTPENRAKGMGAIGAAFGMGFVFGPLIGGVVGAWFGLQWVPVAAAIFSAAALIMTITSLPESHHPGEVTEGVRRFSLTGLRHSLERPVIGMLILLSFVNGFAFAGMEQTFSLLIQERIHLTAQEAAAKCGYLFGGIGVIIVFVQGGMIGRLTKAFGEAALAIVGPLLIAIGLAIVGTTGHYLPVWPSLILGSAFLAFGSSLFNPSIQSLLSRHALKSEQGEILGASQGMASLARGVGPLLAGFLYAQISSGAPYYTSAVICVIVSFWAIAMRSKLRPPVVAQSVEGAFPINVSDSATQSPTHAE